MPRNVVRSKGTGTGTGSPGLAKLRIQTKDAKTEQMKREGRDFPLS